MQKSAIRAATRPSPRFLTTALLLGLSAAFLITGAAQAQGQAQPMPQKPAISKATQAKVAEYRETLDKLSDIQKDAVEANPELKAQRAEFEEMVRSEMVATGFDAEKRGPKLNKMAQKLQDDKLDESQRKELVQEIQENRVAFAQARQKALSKPEVQESAEALQNATLAAMKAQNAETEDLLTKLRSLRAEIQSSMPQPQS